MNNFINIIDQISILNVIKLMIVIGLTVYSFFAFLMMRQIKVMNKAVSTQYGSALWIVGLSHFILAISVLFIAIVAL